MSGAGRLPGASGGTGLTIDLADGGRLARVWYEQHTGFAIAIGNFSTNRLSTTKREFSK
jgi:hypothetical protein